MSKIAVIGSSSSHGGSIITGDPNVLVNGKLVSRKGDLHTCPLPGHGVTAIVGNCVETLIIDGAPVAKVGSVCGCGAVISSGENVEV